MSTPPAHAKTPSNWPIIRRIWKDYLSRQRLSLVGAAMAAVGVGVMTGLLAWTLKPGVELLFGRAKGADLRDVPDFVQQNPLLWVPLVMIAATLIRMVLQVLQSRTINRVGHQLVGDVQSRLFKTLVHADLGRLKTQHSGEHLSRVLFDAGLMREAATNGFINYTQHTVTVLASLWVMAVTDWTLSLGVLVAGPLVSMVITRFGKHSKKAAEGAMGETSALSTAIMESLDGIKIVKIETQEDKEAARVDQVIARRQGFIIKGANARAAAAPATEAVTSTIIALVIAYAGFRAQSGAMSLGGFMAFLIALGAAGQSLRQLANLQTVMAEGMTAASRLFAALDLAPEITSRPAALRLSAPVKGALAFEQVSFGYGHGAVLSNINIDIKPGQSLALVGPSGGGKSSLLNLIPRFYDPTAGRIMLDGHDLCDLDLSSLRQQIALVTQEPFLFDDTIFANIAYGRANPSPQEVERAAQSAAAHDFITALPQGYQTRVGEAGARLSGGQRQRIAIARAFLKDAPILLLDEATSALDTESEAKVQEALDRLMVGRTTLMIAHRLSTIQRVDQIYVIAQGQVVEHGSHDSLLKGGGLYARLAEGQSLEARAPQTLALDPTRVCDLETVSKLDDPSALPKV